MPARLTLSLVLLLGAPAVAGDRSEPGPFDAGQQTVTVTRPDRSTFAATLYYPATRAGVNAPFDPSGGPYPGIVFGHGFLTPVTQYHSTMSHLATHGYFVLAPQSAGGIFPSHAAFAADFRHGLTWFEARQVDGASPFVGQIDVEHFGVSGHSMGGGASLLAAAGEPRIDVVANLAAAETNPSAIGAMTSIVVPVRLIAAEEDGITPIGSNQGPMYDAAHAPRQLSVILGGSHCNFADSDTLLCDNGSITRAAQLAITRRLLTECFDLHLKSDQSAWRATWGPDLDLPAGEVDTTSDAGVTISIGKACISAPSGGSAIVPLVVEQTGDLPDAYALALDDVDAPAVIDAAQTPMLGRGETFATFATIDLAGVPAGARLTILASARSAADGGTRGWTMMTLVVTAGADLDGDGVVGPADLAILLSRWGPCVGCGGDLDGDGDVDAADLAILLGAWS